MMTFDGIVEFVAVAETQGFTAAARRLGVSTSYVSRKISDLEARLGAALIARTTRQVRLTEIGTAYYERCLDLVNGLEDVNHMVRTDQVEIGGILRVSAAGEFAEAHIAPALAEFAKRHRDLVIEIDYNSKSVNFVEEGFDFAIRYGRLQDSSLIARKLIDRTLVAAASPEYLEIHGMPEIPQQLASHSCLTTNSNRWLFRSDEGETEISVSGRWRSNSVRAILHACEAGLGIVYLPRKSYGSCLVDGTLTPILEPYWSASASSWIVYANRNFLPVKAQLAINFLAERFRYWEE
ncbi:LysR family transcriptional regulator [Erythrobacter sp. W53]|uniref:LysR family transcriptional regulator n=1 Tax=Erythrobacter sp. W53 TaxID=3425947 RepID=UPI003D7696CC